MRHNPLIFRYFTPVLIACWPVAQLSGKPESVAALAYNVESGFKPAQADLTKVFLQLAGSLEVHGSPEPYIRHVISEHERIALKYKAATGKIGTSRPEYLTDQRVDSLLFNWKKMSAGLALEALCRESGRNMRYAIKGSWNMDPAELAAEETALNPAEKELFSSLIAKSYFGKEDFKQMDSFYAKIWDKLSDNGRAQISKRTHRGRMDPAAREADIKNDQGGSAVVGIFNQHQKAMVEFLTTDSKAAVNANSLEKLLTNGLKLEADTVTLDGLNEYDRDALKYSHLIRQSFLKRFDHINKNSSTPEGAKANRELLNLMVNDLLILCHSEFMAALRERDAL